MRTLWSGVRARILGGAGGDLWQWTCTNPKCRATSAGSRGHDASGMKLPDPPRLSSQDLTPLQGGRHESKITREPTIPSPTTSQKTLQAARKAAAGVGIADRRSGW